MAKVEGRDPRTYEGCWNRMNFKGCVDPSWDEVKEALEIAWEKINRKWMFVECPPIAFTNDYATAKIRI